MSAGRNPLPKDRYSGEVAQAIAAEIRKNLQTGAGPAELAEKFGFEVDVAKHEDWARDDFSPELHEGVFGTAVGDLMREPAPMANAIRLGRPRRGNGTPSGPVRGDERPSEAA